MWTQWKVLKSKIICDKDTSLCLLLFGYITRTQHTHMRVWSSHTSAWSASFCAHQTVPFHLMIMHLDHSPLWFATLKNSPLNSNWIWVTNKCLQPSNRHSLSIAICCRNNFKRILIHKTQGTKKNVFGLLSTSFFLHCTPNECNRKEKFVTSSLSNCNEQLAYSRGTEHFNCWIRKSWALWPESHCSGGKQCTTKKTHSTTSDRMQNARE